jgi:putative endonuclease
MAKHNETGAKGEEQAVEYLLQQGHTILARNYRFGKLEIDIISQERDTIVFSEVKTRGSTSFGYPEEFVDKKKQAGVRKAADEFMFQQKLNLALRFDVISILHKGPTPEILHIKDAFYNGGEASNMYN